MVRILVSSKSSDAYPESSVEIVSVYMYVSHCADLMNWKGNIPVAYSHVASTNCADHQVKILYDNKLIMLEWFAPPWQQVWHWWIEFQVDVLVCDFSTQMPDSSRFAEALAVAWRAYGNSRWVEVTELLPW